MFHLVLLGAVLCCLHAASVQPRQASSWAYQGAELQAATFAVQSYNQQHRPPFAYKLLRILEATPQIYPPARVMFTMTVQMGQTVCRNRPHLDLASCDFQDPAQLKMLTCRMVVLVVPNSQVPSSLLEQHCS